MRRILLAAALAVAVHGYLLGSEPEWLNRRPPDKPKPPVITMTLTYRLPPRPEPKPPAKTAEISLKKSVTAQKKEKPKPVSKPRPQKKVAKKPRKLLKPKKKVVKPPKKPIRPEEKKIEPKPRPIMASLQPMKKVQTRAAPDIPAPPRPEPISEPEESEVVEVPSDAWADIPDDILEEPKSEEKAEIASLSPIRTIRKARPAYRENPRPEYPRLARRRGYQGTTILEVLVGRTGRVIDIRVLTSSGYEILDNVAVASVKGWLFEPGMRGDQKVEMWVKVPVRFQLK